MFTFVAQVESVVMNKNNIAYKVKKNLAPPFLELIKVCDDSGSVEAILWCCNAKPIEVGVKVKIFGEIR